MARKPRESERPEDRAPGPRADRAALAYERLRDLIIDGKLAPGARIMETELASRLGVSRTPVRGALQRLRQEGYVVASDGTQQSKLWVAPLTRDDAHELFGIVCELESLAASWAAERSDAERSAVCGALREINGRFAVAAEPEVPEARELFRLDREFHSRLVDAGSGPRLQSLHRAIKPQAERYLLFYLNALISQIDESVREHVAIIAAIESGSSAEAKDAVCANWHNASRRLGVVMAQLGERGVWE